MLNFLFLRTRAFMFSKDDKGEKEGSTAVVETASQFFYFILFYFFTCQKELWGSLNYAAVFVIQPLYLIQRLIFPILSVEYHGCIIVFNRLSFVVGGSAELPTDPNEEDANDGNKLIGDGKAARYDDHLTPAERRYIEERERIDVHRLAKTANKSHRDRIQDFNQYLANMSEHYDIPKVGPGWDSKAYDFEGRMNPLFVNLTWVLCVPNVILVILDLCSVWSCFDVW
jgi:hypothetical protein